MHALHDDPEHTALLVVDPYNDWLASEGKLWERISDVAEAVNLVDNLISLVGASRLAGVHIVYVPHRRWESG